MWKPEDFENRFESDLIDRRMESLAQRAMKPQMIEKISDHGIIAVLVIEELKHALPTARALLDGGVDTIELTLRTPVALEAAKRIKKELPEMTVGIGTVLTIDQVKASSDIGADFAVAPGCNPRIIDEAIKNGLSFAPGVMTPSDIEIAIEHGCRLLKFFPAETAGGLNHLKNMAAPYQYLGLKFIPLGGCNLGNAASYLESNLIAAVGGSWLARNRLIQEEKWSTITKNAREIKDLIQKMRNK